MGENVTFFGDLADDYDALVASDEKALDNYVEESGYSVSSMVLASSAISVMRFAKWFTDMGRLGNGVILEGGVKGFAKDGLRVLNVVGTAGAVASRASGLLKVVQAANANTCAWVSQTNAVRLAGQRFLLTLGDLAKRAGVNLNQIALAGRGAGDYQKMLTAMQQLGIRARFLFQGATGSSRTFEGLFQALRTAGKGVVTFSVRFGANGASGHRLYATIGRMGQLIIRDPATSRIFTSADELRQAFSAASLSASEAIFVPSSLLVHTSHFAQAATEIGAAATTLLFQTTPVVHVQAKDAQTAIETLHIRELAATDALPKPPHIVTYRVQHGDWLSKIAAAHYGNMHKWPLIYEANRKVVGPDPNRIRPGQELVLPALPKVSLKTSRKP